MSTEHKAVKEIANLRCGLSAQNLISLCTKNPSFKISEKIVRERVNTYQKIRRDAYQCAGNVEEFRKVSRHVGS